jgi:transcriptional regulator with XRE-family HTH domain
MPKKRPQSALDAFDEVCVRQEAGTLLRQARKAHGLKQRDIARLIGLDQSMIALVEKGERFTSLPHTVHWSRVVQVPMGVLFPEPSPSSFTRLLRVLAGCPPEVHDIVFDWVIGWAHVSPESLAAMLRAPDAPRLIDREGV